VLAYLNKGFNRMDLQIPVLVHPKLGLGPMYIDLDRRIRYPTIAREAAAAIQPVIFDSATRDKMGNAALERWEENFDSSVLSRRVTAILDSLIS